MIQWGQPNRPTTLRTGRSPFDALRCLLSSCLEKRASLSFGFSHGLIHERRDAVVVVACDELGQRPGVEFAAGSLQTGSETLRILEDIIRDRNSGFHTKSITATHSLRQRPRNGKDQLLAATGLHAWRCMAMGGAELLRGP